MHARDGLLPFLVHATDYKKRRERRSVLRRLCRIHLHHRAAVSRHRPLRWPAASCAVWMMVGMPDGGTWLAFIPCCRASDATDRADDNVSSTIRRFSSVAQYRRRPDAPSTASTPSSIKAPLWQDRQSFILGGTKTRPENRAICFSRKPGARRCSSISAASEASTWIRYCCPSGAASSSAVSGKCARVHAWGRRCR
jgi:hypothetical protein